MESFAVIKKNEIISSAGRQMELENIMLSKISQTYKVEVVRLYEGARQGKRKVRIS